MVGPSERTVATALSWRAGRSTESKSRIYCLFTFFGTRCTSPWEKRMSSETLVFGACPAPMVGSDGILLAHGSGGKLTGQLIEQVIVPALHNRVLASLD